MPTALITGITGQDGSYLADFLLEQGYDVVGVVRRTSHDSYERIGHLLDRVRIVPADLLDQRVAQLKQIVVGEGRLDGRDDVGALLEDWDLHGAPPAYAAELASESCATL